MKIDQVSYEFIIRGNIIMILPKNNNNQGVFLELLVTAKSAIIRYLAGYQYDIRPDTG